MTVTFEENNSQPRHTEERFQPDVYGSNETRQGAIAVATLLQNLLIMRPGDIPTQPRMGVDIGSYQFEYASQDTLDQISSAFMSQATAWVPRAGVRSARAYLMDDGNRGKSLAILVRLPVELGFPDGELGLFAGKDGNRTISNFYF